MIIVILILVLIICLERGAGKTVGIEGGWRGEGIMRGTIICLYMLVARLSVIGRLLEVKATVISLYTHVTQEFIYQHLSNFIYFQTSRSLSQSVQAQERYAHVFWTHGTSYHVYSSTLVTGCGD